MTHNCGTKDGVTERQPVYSLRSSEQLTVTLFVQQGTSDTYMNNKVYSVSFGIYDNLTQDDPTNDDVLKVINSC